MLFDAGMFIGAPLTGDPRHAAAALVAGITTVFTYDFGDWAAFESDELHIAGPPSVLASLGRQ